MEKYSEYKDSGVDWIGRIPLGWSATRLKYLILVPLQYGANEPAPDDNVQNPRYIRITDFGEDGLLKPETFKSLPFEIAKDYLLKDGDILFARSGATVGKTFQFKNYAGQACFAGYLIKAGFDDKKVSSDFINYFTKSNFYENWKLSTFQQATIQNIGADKYNNLLVSIPENYDEQTQIAQYLDHKTAQIDKLISDKEKLIELLNEERAAVINQAVTKGINPDVPMKNSGVDWLGEIPEHWKVGKLKYFCELVTDGSHYSPQTVEVGKRYVSVKDVKDNFIDFSECKQISEKDFDLLDKNGCRPQKGDILLTKDGTIGRAAIVQDDNDFVILSSLALIRPLSQIIDTQYFKHYLICSKNVDQMFSCLQGSALTRITLTIIDNLIVVVPPLDEQTQILYFIEAKISEIDALKVKAQQEITLLIEYKTALISEVVTGKVDVRNEVVPESEALATAL